MSYAVEHVEDSHRRYGEDDHLEEICGDLYLSRLLHEPGEYDVRHLVEHENDHFGATRLALNEKAKRRDETANGGHVERRWRALTAVSKQAETESER